MPRAGYESERVPLKAASSESNRGKECSGALTKPDAPAYSPLHTHALRCLLSLLELLLNAADGSENWAGSFLGLPRVHRLLYRLPLTWSGSRLPVCVPISLSSCLLLFTSLSFCLAGLFLIRHHPHNPPPHPSDTRGKTRTRDYSTLSLSCTSSPGSTASTCINAPQQCV